MQHGRKQCVRFMQAAPRASSFVHKSEAGRKTIGDLLFEIKKCTRTKNLQMGRRLHADAMDSGAHSSMHVSNALMNMYVKCGSITEARTLFESIKEPDVVSWTSLMLGYADRGESGSALDLFARMRSQGCTPNSFTYVSALKACGRIQSLARAKQLHLEIGPHSSVYVSNALIDMYAKCGSMKDARRAFDDMKLPDVVSWNALISGYAEKGEGDTALELFARMKAEQCVPDSFTFVAAIKACTSFITRFNENGRKECLERGKKIHSEVGLHGDDYVQSTLIDMYAKCGNMVEAKLVFDKMRHPGLVSWSSLIWGYAENGDGITALDLFQKMKLQGCVPDSFTFVAALKACASFAKDERGKAECRKQGKQIHLSTGCHYNIYVQNALIDMYAKCGCMMDAKQVFDSMSRRDIVSWNALILGYAENGNGPISLDLFKKMRTQGCTPDSISFVAALKACISLIEEDGNGREECLELGRRIHSEIGCHSKMYVQNTSIDMYAKCGSMVNARNVFDHLKDPDVVAWTALIMGYAENGDGGTALEMFERMKTQGCKPDSITLAAAMKACSSEGTLEWGRRIHAEVDSRSEQDVVLVTCLVDFYAKCGSMIQAQEVFDLYPKSRDTATWTALLAGYGRLGESETVFALFQGMQDAGFRPNRVTFLCVLTCCIHAGLVGKAVDLFDAMRTRFRITPTVEHYNCIVDILGRSNKLDEGIALVQSMGCRLDVVTWITLLSACRKWKNVWMGRLVIKCLLCLDDGNSTAFVLMGELYGSRGMLEAQQAMVSRVQSNGMKMLN